MLTLPIKTKLSSRTRQKGVVLVITLIMLAAMTLAVIALVRSVDTTNVIAGNLAFKQSATHSGDIGVEAGISWLQLNSGSTLWNDSVVNGYSATRQDPAAGQTWDAFWTVLDNAGQVVPLDANADGAADVDAAGNSMFYTIQRLCNGTGDPAAPGTGCSVVPAVAAASDSSSQDAGTIALQFSGQVYYRITTRIEGPRNAVSYVQSIIAL